MTKLTDNSIMPFGVHKGKRLEDVPSDYLLYIYNKEWIVKWAGVQEYIKDNIDVLEKQAREEANKK